MTYIVLGYLANAAWVAGIAAIVFTVAAVIWAVNAEDARQKAQRNNDYYDVRRYVAAMRKSASLALLFGLLWAIPSPSRVEEMRRALLSLPTCEPVVPQAPPAEAPKEAPKK
jgi:hypothetical protein